MADILKKNWEQDLEWERERRRRVGKQYGRWWWRGQKIGSQSLWNFTENKLANLAKACLSLIVLSLNKLQDLCMVPTPSVPAFCNVDLTVRSTYKIHTSYALPWNIPWVTCVFSIQQVPCIPIGCIFCGMVLSTYILLGGKKHSQNWVSFQEISAMTQQALQPILLDQACVGLTIRSLHRSLQCTQTKINCTIHIEVDDKCFIIQTAVCCTSFWHLFILIKKKSLRVEVWNSPFAAGVITDIFTIFIMEIS